MAEGNRLLFKNSLQSLPCCVPTQVSRSHYTTDEDTERRAPENKHATSARELFCKTSEGKKVTRMRGCVCVTSCVCNKTANSQLGSKLVHMSAENNPRLFSRVTSFRSPFVSRDSREFDSIHSERSGLFFARTTNGSRSQNRTSSPFFRSLFRQKRGSLRKKVTLSSNSRSPESAGIDPRVVYEKKARRVNRANGRGS